jgi:hypothetical protein
MWPAELMSKTYLKSDHFNGGQVQPYFADVGADPVALQPFTLRVLIAGLSARAGAEGGKSLPSHVSAQPNRSAQSAKPPTS